MDEDEKEGEPVVEVRRDFGMEELPRCGAKEEQAKPIWEPRSPRDDFWGGGLWLWRKTWAELLVKMP